MPRTGSAAQSASDYSQSSVAMLAVDLLALALHPRAHFLTVHVKHMQMHKQLAPLLQIYSDGALFAFILVSTAQRYTLMESDSRKDELPASAIIVSLTHCDRLFMSTVPARLTTNGFELD